MKFLYQYRTSDNAQHEGVIFAASRDTAYSLLKAKGIKPSRVEEAPGVFNKIFGKGKRWIAIAFLSVALLVAVGILVSTSGDESSRRTAPRSQIYGDPALLSLHASCNWRDVFDDEGDRLLVAYAQPGIPVDQDSLGHEFVTSATKALSKARPDVAILRDDPDEVKKVKRIVNGMRIEVAKYLSAGGSAEGYVERLAERQKIECDIVENVLKEFETLKVKGSKVDGRMEAAERWNERNELLRDMGMRPVPLPDDW